MRGKERGFTLIEMLVVIVIIAILAGLLLPVFHKVKRQAQITTTKGRIQTLVTACQSYQADTTEFPVEDSVNAPTYSFYHQLIRFGHNSPYLSKLKAEELVPIVPAFPERILIKDPWYRAGNTNHLRYFRAPQRADVAYTSEAQFKTALGNFHGNPTSYNLWSFGPDRVDNSSDQNGGPVAPGPSGKGGDDDPNPALINGIGDDLTNWNKYSLSGSR